MIKKNPPTIWDFSLKMVLTSILKYLPNTQCKVLWPLHITFHLSQCSTSKFQILWIFFFLYWLWNIITPNWMKWNRLWNSTWLLNFHNQIARLFLGLHIKLISNYIIGHPEQSTKNWKRSIHVGPINTLRPSFKEPWPRIWN